MIGIHGHAVQKDLIRAGRWLCVHSAKDPQYSYSGKTEVMECRMDSIVYIIRIVIAGYSDIRYRSQVMRCDTSSPNNTPSHRL